MITGASLIAAAAVLYYFSRPLPPPRVTDIVKITHENRPMFAFPPPLTDGSRLYFFTNDASRPVHQMSVKGGESVPLTLGGQDMTLMDVSAVRMEYLVCRPSDSGCELWTEPMLGGSPRRLGSLVVGRQALKPSDDSAVWSPDGRQLAYVRDRELRLADSAGTEVRKLAGVAGHPYWIRWSPDGSRIRFSVGNTSGKHGRMFEVRADGDDLRPVLSGWNPTWDVCCGTWTLDGRYFVFQADGRIWAVREKSSLFQRSSNEPSPLDTGHLRSENAVPSAEARRYSSLDPLRSGPNSFGMTSNRAGFPWNLLACRDTCLIFPGMGSGLPTSRPRMVRCSEAPRMGAG